VTVTVGDESFTTDVSGVATLTLDDSGTFDVYATATGYTRTATQYLYGYRAFSALNTVGRDRREELVKEGLKYLSEQLDENGRIGGSQSVTEWAAMAYGAAGSENTTLFNAVKDYSPSSGDGASEIARHILALEAIGVDSRDFRGANYVARLKNTIVNGQFGDEVYCNDDIFAVLALIAADESFDSEALRGGAAHTMNCVNEDGGVGYAVDGDTDMDTTAAWLMMAARMKGHKDSHGLSLREPRMNAVAFIRSGQHPDGGWGYNADASSNASTSAWVLQSLRARHHEAKAMTTNHRNGFHFLSGMQRSTGALKYDTADSTSLETLNTAYTIMALEGRPMPVNKKALLRRSSR
jgi:prenyltransferase beta subunit